MSDGAHQGVTADRALRTVLQGDDPPGEDEQRTPEQLEERIRSRPLPGDGVPPEEATEDDDEGYGLHAETIAHCFLVLADDDPELLTREAVYTEDDLRHSDVFVRKTLLGQPRGPEEPLWEALKARWPEWEEWVGGASGFMVGWAYNATRFVKGLGPVGNPAIMEVEGDGD